MSKKIRVKCIEEKIANQIYKDKIYTVIESETWGKNYYDIIRPKITVADGWFKSRFVVIKEVSRKAMLEKIRKSACNKPTSIVTVFHKSGSLMKI